MAWLLQLQAIGSQRKDHHARPGSVWRPFGGAPDQWGSAPVQCFRFWLGSSWAAQPPALSPVSWCIMAPHGSDLRMHPDHANA